MRAQGKALQSVLSGGLNDVADPEPLLRASRGLWCRQKVDPEFPEERTSMVVTRQIVVGMLSALFLGGCFAHRVAADESLLPATHRQARPDRIQTQSAQAEQWDAPCEPLPHQDVADLELQGREIDESESDRVRVLKDGLHVVSRSYYDRNNRLIRLESDGNADGKVDYLVTHQMSSCGRVSMFQRDEDFDGFFESRTIEIVPDGVGFRLSWEERAVVRSDGTTVFEAGPLTRKPAWYIREREDVSASAPRHDESEKK